MRKVVVVVGAGVAGMQAAVDLGEMGFHVYLVEKEPWVGGRVARFEKVFPKNESSASFLRPRVEEVACNEKIELMSYSEVVAVRRVAGEFEVTVEQKPRYVDAEKCTSCGQCAEKCPVEVPCEFNEGLGTRGAVYVPLPQQEAPLCACAVVDFENCLRGKGKGEGERKECDACVKACERDAIDFSQEKRQSKVKAGAIILATGAATYDPEPRNDYGYGIYENVVTAMELERLLDSSGSGPTSGKVVRPSDCKEPSRVGFINCVGSRDLRTNAYCSGGVCCMFNLKNAVLLKERRPEISCYIFYTDLRASFRGYEELYNRAREIGVRFVRGRPAEVVEKEGRKGALVVRVEDTLKGKVRNVEVDLVVLGTGIVPQKDAEKMSKMLKIPRGADGFLTEANPKLNPAETVAEGVFVAGGAAGPKDIQFAVAQGSAAAAKAAARAAGLK
ncbi:hypothetical protein B6V00_01710 [ANME-1 cluster archaeon ex4572_4]|nr:MAG: hypothetical protein B6V00_01710 [ANME-1 cluster archaeon ex4572_4]